MTGLTSKDFVSGLFKVRRGKKKTNPKKPTGPIVPKVGKGIYNATSSAGGGITSPLTEQSRTYHPTLRELRSSDSAFVMLYQNIATVSFIDGKGSTVVFRFSDTELA